MGGASCADEAGAPLLKRLTSSPQLNCGLLRNPLLRLRLFFLSLSLSLLLLQAPELLVYMKARAGVWGRGGWVGACMHACERGSWHAGGSSGMRVGWSIDLLSAPSYRGTQAGWCDRGVWPGRLGGGRGRWQVHQGHARLLSMPCPTVQVSHK